MTGINWKLKKDVEVLALHLGTCGVKERDLYGPEIEEINRLLGEAHSALFRAHALYSLGPNRRRPVDAVPST